MSASDNADMIEGTIVANYMELLRSCIYKAKLSLLIEQLKRMSAGRMESAEDIKKMVNALRSSVDEIELMLLQRGYSIRSHFCCNSEEALQALLNEKILQEFLGYLFTCLYNGNKEIKVTCVKWTETDYEKCVSFFHQKKGK